MRKTKVTRIILKTRRRVIVLTRGGSPAEDMSSPVEGPDAECDKKDAIERRKENRTNE